MFEKILTYLQNISPIILIACLLLTLAGVIIARKTLQLLRRNTKRSEWAPYDPIIKNLMTTLKSFLKNFLRIEETTGLLPEKINSKTVDLLSIVTKRDAATGQSFSKRLRTLHDIHPSQTLSLSLDITLEAHDALVRQIPHGPPQKLGPAAEAAHEAYKDLYCALSRERKIVHPNLSPPDDPVLLSILAEKNS